MRGSNKDILAELFGYDFNHYSIRPEPPELLEYESDIEKAEYFQQIMASPKTKNYSVNNSVYQFLRQYFLNRKDTRTNVPNWVRQNQDLAQVGEYIKFKLATYAKRREFIKQEFSPLMAYLKDNQINPHLDLINEGLTILDSYYIGQTWAKALQRKNTDPEGAITSARTLMESVFKTMLDELEISYSKDVTLHELYKKVANKLEISPTQKTEDDFNHIFGGCTGIVKGLGNLRNHLGDAHGQGKITFQPSERHAELAINLAGGMCLFILKTYEHNKKDNVS